MDNGRAIILLAIGALVLGVLLLSGDDESTELPPATGDASTGVADPTLEGATAEKTKAPEPAASEPPPAEVPGPEPERDVAVGDLRIRLAGRVTGPGGAPLADVPVRVYPYFESGRVGDVALMASGRTSADGSYALDFVPRARKVTSRDPWLRLRVAAFHPTWIMGVSSAYVNTREVGEDGYFNDQVDIALRKPFRVRCRVRDTDGRPIAGATCTWMSFWTRYRFVDGTPVEVTTNSDGEAFFRLPVLGEGVILLRLHGFKNIRVSAPGYATMYSHPLRIPDKFTDKFLAEADVVLPAPLEIAGVLQDDTGAPLPDLSLGVTGRPIGGKGAIGHLRYTDNPLRSDAEGRFRIADAPPGKWRLEFTVESHAPARMEVEAGRSDLVVELTRLAPTVFVFRDKQSGAWLKSNGYSAKDLERGWNSTTSGGFDERIEFDELRPGPHEITVQFAGRAKGFTFRFVAEAGAKDPIVMEVPPVTEGATLAGRIVTPGGKPIAGAWLSLDTTRKPSARGDDEAEDDDEDEAINSLEWKTPEDGSFRFVGLAPGRYELAVDADERAPAHRTIDIVAGPDPKPMRIPVGAGAKLTVLLPAVPEGADWKYDLYIQSALGGAIGRFMGEEVSRTEVVFEHMPAGETLVALETSEFRTRFFTGDPYTRTLVLEDERSLRVSFEAARTVLVQGALWGEDGKVMAKSNLQLRRIGSDMPLDNIRMNQWLGSKRASTDETGRFRFAGLLPGRYAISNIARDGKPLVFEVGTEPIEDLQLGR